MNINKVTEMGNEINIEYDRRGGVTSVNGNIIHVIESCEDHNGEVSKYYAWKYNNDIILHRKQGEIYNSSLKYILTELLTSYIKDSYYYVEEILFSDDKNDIKEIINLIDQDPEIK